MDSTNMVVPGQLLDLALPPMLLRASGYTGDAHYVALYWGIGDELYVNDGVRSFTGHWMTFHSWCNHFRILSHLTSYDFGSCEAEARHWLIVDREQKQLFVVGAEPAVAFLRAQWGQPDRVPAPLVLDQEVWSLLTREFCQYFQATSPADIRVALRQQEQWYRELQDWLAQQERSSAVSPLV